jgi:formiminoglutamase
MNTSNHKHFHFEGWSNYKLEDFLSEREGEWRVGQQLAKNELKNAKYVLLGIEEGIGPMANNGFGGSENAFSAFLSNFLNTQVHSHFPATDIQILGSVKQEVTFESVEQARKHVEELDAFVEEILNSFLLEGQIPIIIGGGHNNALPIMRSAAKQSKVHILNLDPHADCRKEEGRHSGNSFSIALHHKTIQSYSVLGLHEAYNNQFILDFLEKHHCFHTYFEDYLSQNRNLIKDLTHVIDNCETDSKLGIEIDMDAMAFMPSSAFSPSGWSVNEVRTFCLELSRFKNRIAYLHLPEAAPKTDTDKRVVGKTLSYLVRDFLRG